MNSLPRAEKALRSPLGAGAGSRSIRARLGSERKKDWSAPTARDAIPARDLSAYAKRRCCPLTEYAGSVPFVTTLKPPRPLGLAVRMQFRGPPRPKYGQP